MIAIMMRPTKVLIAKSRHNMLWSCPLVAARCCGYFLLIGLLSLASIILCIVFGVHTRGNNQIQLKRK